MRALLLVPCLAHLVLAQSSIEQWRRGHEAALTADNGWLTVTGLFWLKEGRNTVGSATSNDIVLPRGNGQSGVFELRGDRITFERPAPPTEVLRPDSADAVSFDNLSMSVIHRGGRYAIRLRDKQSKLRRQFTGLRWYAENSDYRLEARFIPYDRPRPIAITNVLGQTEDTPSPGYAVFTLRGREYRLHPVVEDNQLFFIFRDLTSGKTTYPAGRFLYTGLPRDGRVTLDFNKAENPPCAFTPFATCPLPPARNRLPIAIEAGELDYGSHR